MNSISGHIADRAAGRTTGRLILKGQSKSWTLGVRTTIMGVLNLTPDSFYDGGRYLDHALAVERAHRMVAQGADWIDVGGESTRPGATPVDAEEELKRTVHVVEALAKEGIAVSIDTMKAVVAEAALGAGAEIVNDVSALSHDPGMARVCARYGAAVILMHKRGTPLDMQADVVYADIVREVFAFLEARISFAIENGIDASSIAIDPGIGFGKSVWGSLELIKHLGEFKCLGRPLLVGVSRKSFIGHLIKGAVKGGKEGREGASVGLYEPSGSPDPEDRLAGTIAACTALIMNGAHIVRVHDVSEARDAAAVADAVKLQVINTVRSE